MTASEQPATSAEGRSRYLISRFLWSLGNFASSFGLRLASNVVLTRLLAPEVFGIMVVVSAIRLGMELLTDVGIEQNIVRHHGGLEPRFFNTAWTMQILRGLVLSAIFVALAPWLGTFFDIDWRIFLAIGFAPLLNSLHSTSIFALSKQMEVKQRTLFEFKAEMIGFVASVTLAFFTRSIWALIWGTLIGITARSILSYRLPHPAHKLMLDRLHAREILIFGRWIMVSSLMMFMASNLDRLALGKVAPLAMLGIYGLARTIADIPALMARRLSYQIIFPMMSAAMHSNDAGATQRLKPMRLKLVLLAAVVMGVGAASGDWAVAILYDERYRQAGWMLSLLMFGSFVSILSNFNEGLLLGSGKPAYESGANLLRTVVLGIGLWFGYQAAGFAGAIMAMFAAELTRYLFVAMGQHRTKLSFVRQDIVALATMLVAAAGWLAIRHLLHLGGPWDTLQTLR